MSATELLTVGVVLERRRSTHPWQDHLWRATGVLPGMAPSEEWRLLHEADGVASYLAGTTSLRLFSGETAGYLRNLSQQAPRVYLVLRRAESDTERPLRPFLATVCPTEAQEYLDGDDLVETVPMPPEIARWVMDFTRRFHVERVFEKRGRREREASRAAETAPRAAEPPGVARGERRRDG